MSAHRVDIFKRIVFSIPPLRAQLPGLTATGIIYTAVLYAAFQAFAPVEIALASLPMLAALIFLLPTYLSGETLYLLIEDFPRRWSYFLAGFLQLEVFLYLLVLSGADNPGNAWNVAWLMVITTYLTPIFALSISKGLKKLKTILTVSLLPPVAFGLPIYILASAQVALPVTEVVLNTTLIFTAGGVLSALLLSVNYLNRVNTDVSAFELTSGLLQGDEKDLGLGYTADPVVQTLEIDNGEPSLFAAPHVHPGPLGGFGGGQLTDRMIKALNQDGTGFFLHVPCSHREDLADPSDHGKIAEATGQTEKTGKASKLVHEEIDGVKFYGRRFGDQKLVFMEYPGVDDFDVAVIEEAVDLENVLLVDLHNHDIHEGPDNKIQRGTRQASDLQQKIKAFISELEDLEQSEYRAGKAFNPGEGLAAVVEEVDGQETVLIGTDTNGVTADAEMLVEDLKADLDQALIFSTDTHASVQELAKKKSCQTGKMRRLVEQAAENVSKASIGLKTEEVRGVRLLKQDYYSLVSSVNILIRMFLISLLVFYLLVIAWIW